MNVSLTKIGITVALVAVIGAGVFYAVKEEPVEARCPTPETFSQDFNSWSVEFLRGHPEYAEKEQREGWQRHLEEMGCVVAEDILDNAICADCEERNE